MPLKTVAGSPLSHRAESTFSFSNKLNATQGPIGVSGGDFELGVRGKAQVSAAALPEGGGDVVAADRGLVDPLAGDAGVAGLPRQPRTGR